MASDNEFYPNGPMELPGDPQKNSSYTPRPKRFPAKKLLAAAGAILALAAIGFGIYKILLQDSRPAISNPEDASSVESPVSQADSALNDVPDTAEMKTFKADFPRLEATHPSNWTVTENERGVRFESPEFRYELLNGTSTVGNFRIYIRQGARDIDSKYIGRGVASLPSEVLTYTGPAPGQREQTNLSFFGLDSDDHFAFFFIAGNFSLQKGDTLGPTYGKEAETYIVSGGYSEKALADDLAANPVSLEKFNQTNAYKQALEIVKSLKLL